MKSDLSFDEFENVYQDQVKNILRYWLNEIQIDISAHNYGWRPFLFGFKTDLDLSAVRFYLSYRSIAEAECQWKYVIFCGILGAFPLMLRTFRHMTNLSIYLWTAADSCSILQLYVRKKID